MELLNEFIGLEIEFLGLTINVSNAMLSEFIFFMDLLDGDHEQNLISYPLLLFSYHHLHSKLSRLSSQSSCPWDLITFIFFICIFPLIKHSL